jgi:energy-coupling factor transport system ATP-binding protein
MTSIISLRDVTFTYALATAPALQGITLDIPAGQICGVVGRMAAGKSTLCALCAGFIPNFYNGQISGSALIDGQNVIEQTVADLVRHVGLVSSNPFSQVSGARFTVYEEIGFGLENLGLSREEMAERIDWALAALQLTELRDRSPFALSGGQQQRMVIAATLAMRPPVLVLDEPTAQLDPLGAEHLANILRDLAGQGTTILFAEHRLEWAAGLAERIVVLDAGRLIADGPSNTVLTDPALIEHRIGWPRPATLAAAARARGRWPAGRALPSTLDGLREGLLSAEPTTDHRPPNDQPTLYGGPSVAASEGLAGPSVAASEGLAGPSVAASEGLAGPALTAPSTADHRPLTTDHRPPTNDETSRNTQHATRDEPLTTPIVRIEDIRFTYPTGVEALRGVSLTVGPGERVALLGRNGAGKSTLVRHLNGLLRPSAGQVRVKGVETRTTTVAKCARHVGIVFQDIRNQLFARSVRDELRFGPRNLGYSSAQVEALVDRAIAALKLEDVVGEHPYDLPPARRRLVTIAAVLAMDSELLVLDEPTAGLDNASSALLADLAHDLAAAGKSVFVVSHDLDFCFEALDRVVLMRDGRIVLDSAWSALDDDQLAVLDDAVGLPIGLHTVKALGPAANAELRALLTSTSDLKRDT